MLSKFFKRIIDTDIAPIVVCDTEDIIVYMNPSAIRSYRRDLTGCSIKDCHPAEANEKIDKVLDMFKADNSINIVYTYHNAKENKDVYMVALRDDDGTLIGYYEKHEYRNREATELYKPVK